MCEWCAWNFNDISTTDDYFSCYIKLVNFSWHHEWIKHLTWTRTLTPCRAHANQTFNQSSTFNVRRPIVDITFQSQCQTGWLSAWALRFRVSVQLRCSIYCLLKAHTWKATCVNAINSKPLKPLCLSFSLTEVYFQMHNAINSNLRVQIEFMFRSRSENEKWLYHYKMFQNYVWLNSPKRKHTHKKNVRRMRECLEMHTIVKK